MVSIDIYDVMRRTGAADAVTARLSQPSRPMAQACFAASAPMAQACFAAFAAAFIFFL